MMHSVATQKYEGVFDSYLKLHNNGHDNHTLTLVLKIYLKQISYPIPLAVYFDFDNMPFLIKPWPAGEWARFTRQFKQQCYMWNNKFWLIPPNTFSLLDVKLGKRNIRPNIYCHLYVDIVAGPSGANRIIDVVNLEKKFAAQQRGVRESQLDSGAFRSDANTYDSLDVKERFNSKPDDRGQQHRLRYYTIPHEIGHALDLPHIGVVHQDPLCKTAILMDDIQWQIDSGLGTNIRGTMTGLLAGSSNSSACYGNFAPASRGENVMGGGTKFEETNAQPWVDRIALHTGTDAKAWRVSMTRMPPKFV